MTRFDGKFISGEGDVEYLRMLDIAARMFRPDAEFQNLSMLYTDAWNGFVEGPRWDMWWIQNSYGPSYCALPMLTEPLITFLRNSNDLWFDQMGDGKTPRPYLWHADKQPRNWIPPDGALCDAARPGMFVARQGDGQIDLHDWAMEFTAAGLLLGAESLLVGRDAQQLARDLPRLERCAEFLESRRDSATNLLLAGPGANLLAPSYAGWKKPDGTYGMAYLAGLSVTYVAAVDRLIEVQKLAGREDQARRYAERRDVVKAALPQLQTDEGYFIKSLDPDGTRHGVYGAARHGYFEAVVNHDAACFRVADDEQARKIYDKIASIPGLRPYDVVITNYPSLDDLYETGGFFEFGMWVNGGHWATCEARMIMTYYRVGAFEDARRSMRRFLAYAGRFQLDAPLKDFGNQVWFDKDPVHICYDVFGVPAALLRGLFEYQYGAEAVTLIPHIPPGITHLEQRFPVRFGNKKLHLQTAGAGPVTSVTINGKERRDFDAGSIRLRFDALPDRAEVTIGLGGRSFSPALTRGAATSEAPSAVPGPSEPSAQSEQLKAFLAAATAKGFVETYEASHARYLLEAIASHESRQAQLSSGELTPLGSEAANEQARNLYADTVSKLLKGLVAVMQSHADSTDPALRRLSELWGRFFRT